MAVGARMIRGISLTVRSVLFVMATLGSVFAQGEPSIIIKSLDVLEKRILKLEGDVGRLRKSQDVHGSPDRPREKPDSTQAGFAARLDSMRVRLMALESQAKAAPAPISAAPTGKADSSGNAAQHSGEVASLIGEVREMIRILKAGPASPQAKPAAVSAASGSSVPSTQTVHPGKAASSPLASSPVTGLELKGDLQIQGERKITAASNRNNLDDFWGRLNFGAEYNEADFQSKLNIRIFPEGFGFEPLTGATFDTTGQGSLKVQTQSSSRVVINHAWARYAAGAYRLKFGRFETLETQSANFGNYVDLAPGGKFSSRPAVHNAIEATRVHGRFSGSVLLGTNDNKINRGFLRLYEKFAFSPDLTAAVGYRSNVFDRFKFPDQEILQRFDLNLVVGLPMGWKAFAEGAVLQVSGKDDQTPLLVGVQPFTGKALNLLSLEAEYLPDRLVSGKSKELLMNVHARKVLGRLKLEGGLASDLADPEWNSYSFGFRITSNIK
jgi:hypothetical protein